MAGHVTWQPHVVFARYTDLECYSQIQLRNRTDSFFFIKHFVKTVIWFSCGVSLDNTNLSLPYHHLAEAVGSNFVLVSLQ